MQTASASGNDPPASHAHRNRVLLKLIVAVIGFFCVWGVLAHTFPVGVLGGLVHIPSALLVSVVPMGILLAVWGWTGTAQACACLSRRAASADEARRAAAYFELGAAFFLAAGFLATLIALILMLQRLDDPRTLGPHMAAALFSQLYGVFLALACVALSAHVARRHLNEAPSGLTHRAASVAGLTTIAGCLTTLIAFGILMLSVTPAF